MSDDDDDDDCDEGEDDDDDDNDVEAENDDDDDEADDVDGRRCRGSIEIPERFSSVSIVATSRLHRDSNEIPPLHRLHGDSMRGRSLLARPCGEPRPLKCTTRAHTHAHTHAHALTDHPPPPTHQTCMSEILTLIIARALEGAGLRGPRPTRSAGGKTLCRTCRALRRDGPGHARRYAWSDCCMCVLRSEGVAHPTNLTAYMQQK